MYFKYVVSTLTTLYIKYNFKNIFSDIRYHITWKTANNEIVKTIRIALLVLLIYCSEHIFGIIYYFGTLYWDWPQIAAVCAGKSQHGLKVVPFFQIVKSTIILMIGMAYDGLLINFLLIKRQKNSTGKL